MAFSAIINKRALIYMKPYFVVEIFIKYVELWAF